MSISGDPNYDPLYIGLECGPSCLNCCDCRTGLNVLMDGNLPIVGTYTLEDSSSFEIHEIHWGFDTTKPLFLGPMNEPTGHVGHTCCTRQIGCALATFSDDSIGGGAVKYYLAIYASLTATYLRIEFSYVGDSVIWFEFLRAAVADVEKPLCALPKGVATELTNAQLADYSGAPYRYITDADSNTFMVTPTYCNNDGTFTHGGGELAANNCPGADPDCEATGGVLADGQDPCECSKATHAKAYTATVTGLDVCYTVYNMKPNVSTWDFDLLFVNSCLPANDFVDGDATGSTGVKCDPLLSLCATPTWEASIAISFDYAPTDDPIVVSFQIDYYCNGSLVGSIFGAVEVPYNCVDGIDGTPFTIDLEEGGTPYGTVTIEFNPA